MAFNTIIAVTGHRPPKADLVYGRGSANTHIYTPMTHLFGTALEVDPGVKVITGMALGIDQLVAEACIEVGVPFTAAIPFRGQQSRWPAEGQQWYHWLLDHAHKVIVVSEGGFTRESMQVRNEWMVDHADRLWAWWDGSRGGTSNCIRYAKAEGVPVVNQLPHDYQTPGGAF